MAAVLHYTISNSLSNCYLKYCIHNILNSILKVHRLMTAEARRAQPGHSAICTAQPVAGS